MLTNYYTLRLLAHDLNRRLRGFILTSIFTQEKNELVMSFRQRGTVEGSQELSVSILCEPSRNAVFARTAYHRARRNSVDLFERIVGAMIKEIRIAPADREITFTTDGPYAVVAQIFGSRANVYLVDGKRRIEEAFLRSKAAEDILAPLRSELSPPQEREELRNRLLREESESLLQSVKRVYPLLGTDLARELIIRCSLDPHMPARALTLQECQRILSEHAKLEHEVLHSPRPRIYFHEGVPAAFSLIELQSSVSKESVTYESIHDAVRAWLGATRQRKATLGQKSRMLEQLLHLLKRDERTLEKLLSQTKDARPPEEYEMMGKLLTAHLDRVKKGVTAIELENEFSEERELIAIPLEPHLTPVKNAERYFERARKSRRSLQDREERGSNLRERIRRLKFLRSELEAVGSAEELKSYLEAHGEELTALGVMKKEGAETTAEAIPFRVFRVEGGFEVWTGKSSQNNDLLTLRYAKPHDLWFHARGSGGSHVILRRGTGKGEPSKRALHQAAAIAAYYSKMKNSRLVPVAMTEKKYVRKPRGAPPGTVAVEREKTLFVEPGLPEGTEEHRGLDG